MQHLRYAIAGCTAAIAIVSINPSARAASQTWDGDGGDANWTTAANWVGNAVPGINASTNAHTTGDIATFNAAFTPGGTVVFGDSANPVVIDANRKIARVVFDTANAGAYFIGAAASPPLLFPQSAIAIDVTSTVVNPQTFNATIAPHLPSSTNGVLSLRNNATSTSATLNLAGGIGNASNSSRGTQWTIEGTNTGANTITGLNLTNNAGVASTLIKAGAGTWVLAGTNLVAGGSTVNEGLLAVNGTLNTGVTVNSTGTLGGGGSTGAITLNGGGRVAPGTATGVLGNLAAPSEVWISDDVTSGKQFNLSTTDTTSDLLNLSGAFTKGATGTSFLWDFTGGVEGNIYTLVNFGSTNFVQTDFGTGPGSQVLGNFILNPNSLQFEVVPEPGTVGMLLGGCGILFAYRRVRRRLA